MDDPVLVRLDHLREQIADLAAKLDRLPDTYVSRREWDHNNSLVADMIEQIRRTLRDGPAGTRQTVALILSGVAVAVSALAATLR